MGVASTWLPDELVPVMANVPLVVIVAGLTVSQFGTVTPTLVTVPLPAIGV